MFRLMSFFLCYFLALTAHAGDFTLKSKAFADGITIPVLYTCDGRDISPDLFWSNLPIESQSIAIILSDNDAPNGTFYHWVLFNIPTNVTELEQDIIELPAGAITGKNSWGKNEYNGPCPPKGSLHHYTFTLYALDIKLLLTADVDAPTLLKNMQGHVLEKAKLTMGYARWPV